MKEKVFINNHSGALVDPDYPNSTAYIREDIYRSIAKTLEIEQDKNESLRREIEILKKQ